MEFTQLPIPPEVLQGVLDAGFVECTPIQSLTLPLTLEGVDVAGQAQTGTGKTAAFLIAVFSRLLKEGRGQSPEASAGHPSQPRALIIAPTRELVVQIDRDARILGRHTGFTIAAVYGGVDYEEQKESLAQGGVDLLIGTPGRLIDYFKQKTYRVDQVSALVIDEADRMFDMGFIVDLRYLLRRLPSFEHRLSMLFSATLSYRAQELSYEFMNSPEMLTTAMDVKTVHQVTQALYHVEGKKKISLLVGILRRDLQEEGEGVAGSRVMLFVNTKRMGEKLKNWLRANEIHAGYLSGDVPQSQRLKVLQRFQAGEIPVLIATDVAGRGLHIDGVTHVINYDLPENAEDYVHRIGRTARAGAKGDAISLVDEDGAYNLEAVENYLGIKIPVEWNENELYVNLTFPPRDTSPRPSAHPNARSRRSESSQNSRGGGPRFTPRRVESVRPAVESQPQVEAPSVEAQPATGGGEAAQKKRRRRRKPASAASSQDGQSTPGSSS